MESPASFNRPSLEEALTAWKKLLAERDFSTDILWIFEENLCFEKSRPRKAVFIPASKSNSRRRLKMHWTSLTIIFPKPTRASFFIGLGSVTKSPSAF